MSMTDKDINDLLHDAADLQYQATHEKSHFYVAKTLGRCIAAITELRSSVEMLSGEDAH